MRNALALRVRYRRLLLLAILVLSLAGAFPVYAATYLSIPFDGTQNGTADNPSYATGALSGGHSQMAQELGSGLSAPISGATVGMDRFIAGTYAGSVVLYCFEDAGYSVPCVGGSTVATSSSWSHNTTGTITETVSFSPMYVMIPTRYYKIAVDITTAGCGNGSLGCYWRSRISTTGIPAAMITATSSVYGAEWFSNGSSNVQVFSLTTPDGEYISSSEPAASSGYLNSSAVRFRGYYNRSCSLSQYTHAHFLISEVATASTTSFYVPLSSCGLTAYDFGVSSAYLPSAGSYTYKVRMTDSAPPLDYSPGGTTLSASTTFSVLFPPAGTSGSGSTLPPSILDESLLYDESFDSYFQQANVSGGILASETATSTAQFLGNFSLIQGIRNTIGQKAPFNWFFEAGSAFAQGAATSSSGTSTIAWDFEGVSTSTDALLGGNPIELFSANTISQFAPNGFLTLIKTIISAVLWLAVFFFWYYRVRAIFA